MKPVAILRHARPEGPAYFATYLDRRSIPWQLVAIDEEVAPPKDARLFSAIVLMGGPMSVNDDLPWIAPVVELIRDAVRNDVPTLGHCLGAQLMCKAFGGAVTRNPVWEIGWGDVRIEDNGVAREWFGEDPAFESFHWHGETFSIPPGATRVLSNGHCANQAFALGKHLGLQCHIEMTEDMVRAWCRGGRRDIERNGASPGVQRAEDIVQNLAQRIERLHHVANRVYDHWSEGLAPNRGS